MLYYFDLYNSSYNICSKVNPHLHQNMAYILGGLTTRPQVASIAFIFKGDLNFPIYTRTRSQLTMVLASPVSRIASNTVFSSLTTATYCSLVVTTNPFPFIADGEANAKTTCLLGASTGFYFPQLMAPTSGLLSFIVGQSPSFPLGWLQ